MQEMPNGNVIRTKEELDEMYERMRPEEGREYVDAKGAKIAATPGVIDRDFNGNPFPDAGLPADKPPWRPEDSRAKARRAAQPAAEGMAGGALGAGALLQFVRLTWPDLLPWSEDLDARVIEAIAVLGGIVWTALRVYWRDRAKHI
jgi:hypothetical protein